MSSNQNDGEIEDVSRSKKKKSRNFLSFRLKNNYTGLSYKNNMRILIIKKVIITKDAILKYFYAVS